MYSLCSISLFCTICFRSDPFAPKSGFTSLSAGIRGFTLNIGRKGTRTTTSLPGTGLSYQSPVRHYDASASGANTASGARRESGAWLIVVVVLLLLWGVVWFVGKL